MPEYDEDLLDIDGHYIAERQRAAYDASPSMKLLAEQDRARAEAGRTGLRADRPRKGFGGEPAKPAGPAVAPEEPRGFIEDHLKALVRGSIRGTTQTVLGTPE